MISKQREIEIIKNAIGYATNYDNAPDEHMRGYFEVLELNPDEIK